MSVYDIKYNKLTDEDIQVLVDKLKAGATGEEREDIYLKLLGSICKYVSSMLTEYTADVIQSVYLEILENVTKYDTSKGAFLTFIKPVVKHAITTSVCCKLGLTCHEYAIYKRIKKYITLYPDGNLEGYNTWVTDTCGSNYRTKKKTWNHIQGRMDTVKVSNVSNVSYMLHEEQDIAEMAENKIYIDRINDIILHSDILTNMERQVMIHRYMHGYVMTFVEMEGIMHKNKNYLCRLHERAIDKIKEAIA